MGRMGGSKHLRREATPVFWPIYRKKYVWAIKPDPGPHPFERCIPLGIIIRDLLGYAETMREAKKIVVQGKVLVDWKVRCDVHFPVGLMDVLSIPEINKSWRVLPYGKGLALFEIGGEEVKYKICRIENKTTLPGGHIQLNLHDGRNIIIRCEDPRKPVREEYHTLDTLRISLPDQAILEHLKLDVGMMALIVGGDNLGRHGFIKGINLIEGQKKHRCLVTIEEEGGSAYQTILDYLFVVGDKTSRISLPRVVEVA